MKNTIDEDNPDACVVSVAIGCKKA